MARLRDTLRNASGDLVLESVTKTFGDFTAVDDLDLHVPRGTFFALLGPSGCGKTTTLRMVAGLEQPTRGSVRIGDTDLTGSRPYERPVNTVFQSYALFPHLDVLENVEFGPKRRKVRDARAQAEATLELVQLTDLARRKPGQLSGGQQQRVAVARALVNRPEVLLLDEPLGALDLKLRRQMQVELKRIQSEVGITFIHVTHDQEEAMTMADSVAVMHAGKIEQMGSPTQLYDLPRTAFVANFLGQSNLVRAQVSRVDGEWVGVRIGDREVALERARMADPSVAVGAPIGFGVRPEKLRIHGPGETDEIPSGHSTLGPGRVVDISFTGVSTQYLLDLPGIGRWGVFAQNLDVEEEDLRPGDEVSVSWDPRHAFGLRGDDDLEEAVELLAGGPAS